MLHRLVGRQHDEADRRARSDPLIEFGRQDAEIDDGGGEIGEIGRHGLRSFLSGGHQAVHRNGWLAASDEIGGDPG